MRSLRRAYTVWSSCSDGGASVRAMSSITLGAMPIATRASSLSVAGVANSAAAAT